jgi:hypothetical protein
VAQFNRPGSTVRMKEAVEEPADLVRDIVRAARLAAARS